jgi:hypothetical protein
MLQGRKVPTMNETQNPTKPAAPAQDKPTIAPVAQAPGQNQNQEQGKPVATPVAAPADKA